MDNVFHIKYFLLVKMVEMFFFHTKLYKSFKKNTLKNIHYRISKRFIRRNKYYMLTY